MEKVVVINYMGRHGSGNINAYMMAKALLEQDEKVVAVVSSYADNIESWRKLKLTQLVEVKTYQNVYQFVYRSINFYLYEAKNIVQRLLEKYDIKAVYNPMLTYWTYGLNRYITGGKIITCNHDPIPHSGDRRKWTFEKALKKSDIIIVHTRKFVDFVKKKYKGKRVIYMPLQSLNAYDLPNKTKSIEYDKDKINFLFFGTFSKYKGLEVLAQAYKKVYENVSNVTLTVVGSGDFSPYRNFFDEIMDENVTIINRWIEDSEVESFFCGNNVIVITPYTDATQSGPIQLALQYNDIVIASNVGGLPEQIDDGKNGILVEPSNVNSLADAMIWVATNEKIRDNLKKNILMITSINNDKKIARQLINIIRE